MKWLSDFLKLKSISTSARLGCPSGHRTSQLLYNLRRSPKISIDFFSEVVECKNGDGVTLPVAHALINNARFSR